MRLYWSILCLQLFSHISFAQIMIEGSLQDSKEPVVNATVLLYASGNEKILAYTFSDAKGKFQFSVSASTDSLEIEIRHISYEKIRQKIPAISQKLHFTLKESSTEIKEIEIKLNPVTIRSDTTTYNVRSFASKADRNIKDVLAKMPGVEVGDNGLIKYKGKPISKFYIENLDMLGKRYNIASENVPWEMVDEVEFYENHQDIKLLDSLGIKGSNPALNLRLTEKAKKSIALNGETGLGLPFLLWDSKIVALKFFRNHQFINILQSDNIGKDSEKSLTEHAISLEQLLLRRFPQRRSDLLQLSQIANPPLERNRYLFNQSASTNLNGVVKMSHSAQMRYHFTYLLQNNQTRSQLRQQVFFPTDTIAFTEKQIFTQRQHLLQSEIEYEKNLKNIYTKNVLTAKKYWESQEANVNFFGILNVSQKLNNPYFQVANEYQNYRLQAGKIVQWVSNSYFKLLPQHLQVSPTLWQIGGQNRSTQFVKGATLQTENFRTSSQEWKKFRFRSQTGLRVAYRNLESYLLLQNNEENKDTLQNNLQDFAYQLFANFNTERKIGKQLTLNASAEYAPLALWQNTEKGVRNNFFHQYFWRLNFSQRLQGWLFSGGGSYSSEVEDETHWFNTEGIFQSYRSVFRNGLLVPERKGWQWVGNIFYNNILGGWSWNSDISFLQGFYNYRYDLKFIGIVESREMIALQTPFQNLMANTRFNKYFYKARTNLAISGTFMQNQFLQRQNNQDFTSVFQNWQAEGKIVCNYWSFLNLQVQSRFNVLQTELNTQKIPQTLQLRHQLYANFIIKQWIFTAKWYSFQSFQQGQSLSNHFIDISLQRKFAQWETELQIFNLTNQQNFILAQIQENTFRETLFELRPLNILLKASWKMGKVR
ncbi:hypothetical protein [Raineya sp.]|jgi:hypothetical protein